jgi:excisionase family DNA binding protein
MELTLGQAAKVTGLGKPTLTRAIKAGRLSATRREDGSYAIDPSELSRVYKVSPETVETVSSTGYTAHRATPDGEARATPRDPDVTLLAVAQAELRHLSERLEEVKASQEDLRRERDDWREQAQRLALAAPIPAPGPVAPPEAAASISAPAPITPIASPPEPEPRRSLLRYWFGLRAAG